MLTIEDSKYKGDPDMQHIVHRLLMAATNHDLRLEMNVEDEYFKAIEDRDTAIMNRERRIKEQEQQLSKQEQQLSKQEQQISENEQRLSEQEQQLMQQRLMIKAMVQSMINRGMDINEIALIMNKKPNEIKSLLD